MAYDARAESVALIETRRLQPVRSLSRRRRFVAMAVDVADDIATTLFVRRSVGCDVLETWVLARRGESWQVLGGGGGSADHEAGLLTDRPAEIPPDEISPWNTLPGVDPRLAIGGRSVGGVHDAKGGRDLVPWSGRWISYGIVYASSRVAAIEIAGRMVDVPWHGHTLLTWVGHRPPQIRLIGLGGEPIGTTRLPTQRS